MCIVCIIMSIYTAPDIELAAEIPGCNIFGLSAKFVDFRISLLVLVFEYA